MWIRDIDGDLINSDFVATISAQNESTITKSGCIIVSAMVVYGVNANGVRCDEVTLVKTHDKDTAQEYLDWLFDALNGVD